MRLLPAAIVSAAAASGAAVVVRPAGAAQHTAPQAVAPGRRTNTPSASAFLARAGAGAAPQVCVDKPVGWADVMGNTCVHYKAYQYCTPEGGFGDGWKEAIWGPFGNYAAMGSSAERACCACGGGQQGDAAKCETMKCPLGYSAKPGELYCASQACDPDVDIETCCEASAAVKAAVDEVKVLIETLKQEVQHNISAAGAAHRQSAATVASSASKDAASKFRAEADARRNEAILTAQQRFAGLTAHSETLGETAGYQIRVSGYLAALHAVQAGDARVHSSDLQKAATNFADAFANAREAWGSAVAASHDVVDKSKKAWEEYHADLNATWPQLVRSIHAINGAIDVADEPAKEVRWADQKTRLIGDLAQVGKQHVLTLASQVAAIEDRASGALATTVANKGKVAALKEMVDGFFGESGA